MYIPTNPNTKSPYYIVIAIGIFGSSMQHFIGIAISIEMFTIYTTSQEIDTKMDLWGIPIIACGITIILLLIEWKIRIRKRLPNSEWFFIFAIFIVGIPFWIEHYHVEPNNTEAFHVCKSQTSLET